MKFETFSTLHAVLRSGTLAAAAAQTNLTPGAVSMRIKQLEAYFGEPLFDRSGLRVRPTRLAHQVSNVMGEALTQLESLRRQSPADLEGVMRLGVIESMQPVILPGVLTWLRERYPRLKLSLSRGRSIGLAAAVKAGELDAALVAQPEKGGSTRLRWHAMLRLELLLVAPPWATKASAAALFRQHDWIRYDRHTVTGSMAARFVKKHLDVRNSDLELDSIPAILAMVSAGLGVSIVQIADPRLCDMFPVRIVRLGRATPRWQLSFVTRKADDDSRTLMVLRESVRSVLSSFQREHERAAISNGNGRATERWTSA